ncbi:hypothetical protein AALP_AA3G175800 [Arabis alpina]|uniref:F-box domain-containing protein n=1 Tax=Arabis alpina TaxID=50452 RepID=A0A087H9V1_ARAAL|nr:hypothetical protein AALP_AA3G175800 [Arabis alpina]
MNNLPQDLVEEILSRAPVTSLRRVRSTCKKWHTLFKDGTFTKKHLAQTAERKAKGEILAILLMNFKLSMVRINLHESNPSIKTRGNLTSLNDSHKLEIIQVCHCDGLVLCVTEDYTRSVVWNPYTGQTRWISIELIRAHHRGSWYGHALGYDKSSHKVLRFYLDYYTDNCLYDIYDVNSKSRRVIDVTVDWEMDDEHHGQSLKGNTYWYAQDKEDSDIPDTVTLSSVREEQLAAMFHNKNTCAMEIWVTTKIEPHGVSWSKFLAVVMDPLSGTLSCHLGRFIVDKEKKTVFVFDVDKARYTNTAYFIGENGYFREVDLGETTTGNVVLRHALSYVPSSMQINQLA